MAEEKTEEATPKKLREARKRGEVPKSREVATAALVLATAGILAATGGAVLASMIAVWDLAISVISGHAAFAPSAILQATTALAADALVPLLAGTVVVAAAASFFQVGPLLALDSVAPKLERIDPIRGTKNLFSQRNFVELAKALLKIGIVTWVAWTTLRDGLRGLVGLAARDAEAALAGTGDVAITLLVRVGGAMAALAALDVLYQRWRYGKDQRMSKDEVKREHKESEGDPHHKAERERVRREILSHGVLEAVRSADVLVVNPTRLAVALKYDEEGELDAPEIVAKGQEDLARRMIRAAEEAGVPVMRDVPLARSLHEIELGDEIPEELYEAVAVVLRAAWKEREAEEGGG